MVHDEDSDRRDFFRKLVSVAAATGVSGLLLGKFVGSAYGSNIVPASGQATFDGPVGIGTTTPQKALDVNGNMVVGLDAQYGISTRIGGGVIKPVFAESGGLTVFYDAGGSAFVFRNQVDTVELMRITDAGNVGIGTTTPADTLHVKTSGDTSVGVDSVSTNAAILRFRDTGAEVGLVFFGGASYAYWGGANSLNLLNLKNGPMVFFTNLAERLRITGAGNIGIGTASPAQMLTVAGDVGQSVVAVNGLVKAAVLVNGSTPAIIRSFNNLPGGSGPSVSQPLGPGTYEVNFGVNVAQRFFSATLLSSNSTDPGGASDGQALVSTRDGNANAVFVRTNDSTGTSTNRSFYLMIF